MDAIELLINRSSQGKLQDPAPDEETLRLCFAAAVRAPDHANLRPWKFQLIAGEARRSLGQALRDSLASRAPESSEEELQKAAQKSLRAPLIIVVSACTRHHPKVPGVEQLLSAGAAAQSILLVLQARGFGGIWRTGPAAYDRALHRRLGLGENESIVAFIYAGTPAADPPPIVRPDPSVHVEHWEG
ncbi:MAG: nitroreductase [Myxococcales bacterium]|nr:nitroreductase [Myxococcales bacterium]